MSEDFERLLELAVLGGHCTHCQACLLEEVVARWPDAVEAADKAWKEANGGMYGEWREHV